MLASTKRGEQGTPLGMELASDSKKRRLKKLNFCAFKFESEP